MKKLLKNRMRRWLSMCMTGVLLALGIATGLGDATPVQAAEKIPISSAEDFLNMESNPSGNYYLTKDITLPENMNPMFPYSMPFTGTLDGKGHKLKYTFQSTDPDGSFVTVAIFGRAKKATFKNLTLANVNINIDAGEAAAEVHPLVSYDEYGKYDKIKVSGTITVKAGNGSTDKLGKSALAVSGLIGSGSWSKLTNCSSSIKIKVSKGDTAEFSVGGFAADMGGENGTVKNCSFSGEISASVKTYQGFYDLAVAGICARCTSDVKISGCTNSGNITFKAKEGNIAAYGICGGGPMSMSSCGNSGKIKTTVTADGHATAAGLAAEVHGDPKKATFTKCWNKGSVSATGGATQAAGLCINSNSMNQCYNKGAVTASVSSKSDESEIGGLCVTACRMQNCYNVGKVTLKGTGYAAGLACSINTDYGDVTNNYSAGKVSAKGGEYGWTSSFFLGNNGVGVIMSPRCAVYDNYYTASTGCSAYGIYGGNNVPKRTPRATKVSSITSKNCPKLSSKYWTYSSKYKRLVLKNNKEK